MKKSVIMIALAALFVMSACTTKKGLPEYDENQCGTKQRNPMKIENTTQVRNSTQVESAEPGSACDIEIPFDDPTFIRIMKGEIVPVKVCHGLGGEGGYTQDWSEDPELVRAYIDALGNLKLEEVLTDEEEFHYVADGINDYIFVLEDDTEVLISLDLNAYVVKDDKQYVFGYSEELHNLNELIRETEIEP